MLTHDVRRLPRASRSNVSDLREYLRAKKLALDARSARIEAGDSGVSRLAATASAEGRSGVRRVRIRDFQIITDSPPDFAGYNLGPSSPELQLGILASCLNHSVLIQAALLGIAIDSLDVDVSGLLDARAGRPGFEAVPVNPHDISFEVRIVSPASASEISRLEEAVEKACPILNLLRRPQSIAGRFQHSTPAETLPSSEAA